MVARERIGDEDGGRRNREKGDEYWKLHYREERFGERYKKMDDR